MWRKFTTWLGTNKRSKFLLALFLVVGISFLVSKPAFAQAATFGDEVIGLIAELLSYIVKLFGTLILAVIDVIISVAQYTGFTNAIAVQKGWTIVRDVTNMFFIVVMLYIAFRTMFGQEANWQSSLIRLLIAAIVINFSRTICGLVIDASQVVMLTFVNGLKDAAAGNFIDMFQLRQMLTQSPEQSVDGLFFVMLALIMSFSSLVIVTLLLIFLVVRIVFLWVLIILSPLAFFLKLSPVGGGMWSKWISRFQEQVLTGPILAFFLWLSLLTAQETNGTVQLTGIENSGLDVPILGNVNLQGYIVGLAMLVVSMMAARTVGGETFGLTEKTFKTAKSKVTGGLKRYAAPVGAAVGGFALGKAGKLLDQTGSLVTGGKYRWSDLGVKAYKGTIKPAAKKVGNVLGLTEESKMKEQIESYKRRGQNVEAEELEKKLIGKVGNDLSQKYKPEALAEKVREGQFADYEGRAALGILASKGHWSLKGKGAEISNIAKKNGLSNEQEYSLREQLEKAGDKQAWLGYNKDSKERELDPNAAAEGQIKNVMKSLDEGKINDLMRGVSKGVHAGIDGEANQSYASLALQNLDAPQFNKLSQGTQNEVFDALKVAAVSETDPAKSAVYRDKIALFTEEKLTPIREKYDKALKSGNQDLIDRYQKQLQSIQNANLAGGINAQGSALIEKSQTSLNQQRVTMLKKGATLSQAIPGIDYGGNATTPSSATALFSVMNDEDARSQVIANMSVDQLKNDVGNVAAQKVTSDDMVKIAKSGKSRQYFAMEAIANKQATIMTPELKAARAKLNTRAGELTRDALGLAVRGGVLAGTVVTGGALAGVSGAVAASLLGGGAAGSVREYARRKGKIGGI